MRKPKELGPQTELLFLKILPFFCSEMGNGLRHFEGGLISICVLLSGWRDGDILE